ncbi:MAG TPA: FAD-dependent oxidoreductase, partial [Deltaproteobacteria bacterium]|nr:FAD-dependent oxidoreductase [Deltaproteobacteria bacterium]
QKNVRVLLGEVTDIDPQNRMIRLTDGEIGYDSLIVAAGMKNNYFGNDSWESHAPGLKTVEDTCLIRQKVFMAFEIAERERDPAARQHWLNFVVVGAGSTGIELSGMLSEITRHTLKGEFRSIRPEDSKVLLIDSADRILPSFAPELSGKAQESLNRLGVTTIVQTKVVAINENGIHVLHGAENEFIPAKTVLWATGVKASPLGRCLAEKTGARTDT